MGLRPSKAIPAKPTKPGMLPGGGCAGPNLSPAPAAFRIQRPVPVQAADRSVERSGARWPSREHRSGFNEILSCGRGARYPGLAAASYFEERFIIDQKHAMYIAATKPASFKPSRRKGGDGKSSAERKASTRSGTANPTTGRKCFLLWLCTLMKAEPTHAPR